MFRFRDQAVNVDASADGRRMDAGWMLDGCWMTPDGCRMDAGSVHVISRSPRNQRFVGASLSLSPNTEPMFIAVLRAR
jgi:hypothetical protein